MGTMGIFALIAGVLGAVISGASNIVTNSANIGQAERNREDTQQFNHDEAELAYQREIEGYNLLYSPQAKVKQFKDAGLSVGLMYGGAGGSGGSVSGAQAGASPSPLATMNPLNNIGAQLESAFEKASEIENREKDTTNKEDTHDINYWLEAKAQQEYEKSVEDVDNAKKTGKILDEQLNIQFLEETSISLDNVLKSFEASYQQSISEMKPQMFEEQLFNLQTQTQEALTRIDGMSIDNANKNRLADATIANLKASTTKMYAEAALAEQKRNESIIMEALGAKKIEDIDSMINQRIKEGALTDAKAKEVYQNITNMQKEYEKMNADIAKTIADTDYRNKEVAWYNTRQITDIYFKWRHANSESMKNVTDLLKVAPTK